MTKLSKLFTTLILILFGLATIALILIIQITKPTSQEVVNNGTNEVKDKIDFSTIKEETADTSNWQDYIDTRLGFKTKLPPDWEVKPLPARYEGADNFVMFTKKNDTQKRVIAEVVVPFNWGHPLKQTIEEREKYQGEKIDNNKIYYSYNYFKIVKIIGQLVDYENRWSGDVHIHYTVYVNNDMNDTRVFGISTFSPQISLENSDLIVHGILKHLERME